MRINAITKMISTFQSAPEEAPGARKEPPDAKQAWHNNLEMHSARQRDELGVAGWKRGQPEGRPSSSREVLVHMYIGRYCVYNIYIYIDTIHPLDPACRQGVCLCG